MPRREAASWRDWTRAAGRCGRRLPSAESSQATRARVIGPLLERFDERRCVLSARRASAPSVARIARIRPSKARGSSAIRRQDPDNLAAVAKGPAQAGVDPVGKPWSPASMPSKGSGSGLSGGKEPARPSRV